MSEKERNAGKEEEDPVEPPLNIATIGSKNRVCLPPTTCSHLKVKQTDHLAFNLKFTTKDRKPYAILVPVKAANFEVDGEKKIETLIDALK